jgi:hypothetical protein
MTKQVELVEHFNALVREGLLVRKVKDIGVEDLQDSFIVVSLPELQVFKLKPLYRGREAALFNSADEYEAVTQALCKKGLLVRVDPAEEKFRVAIEAEKSGKDGLTKMYLDHFKQPKLMPPWRPFYTDEPILTHVFHPELNVAWEQLIATSKAPESWFPIFQQARVRQLGRKG